MSRAALRNELDAWGAAGRTATFWLRDDDLTEPTSHLDRLLDVCGNAGVHCDLAVIPASCVESLAARLENTGTSVLLHGYAHQNRAPMDQKKSELGDTRSLEQRISELREGQARLRMLFADQYLPCLVPPWNRIGDDLEEALPDLSLPFLSTYGPRKPAPAGLTRINTHIDLINWRDDRDFIGLDQAFSAITAHLSARRSGEVDESEPTGLLSHHLDTSEAGWSGLAEILGELSRCPAVRFVPLREAMAADQRLGQAN